MSNPSFYFQINPWKVIETKWKPEKRKFSESIMSLGNGYMGMRGNFEESYTGSMHIGTYYGGIYYPEKTRVGWWKNGYPENFAKVINGPRIFGLKLWVDGEKLDLSKGEVLQFYQELDMQAGVHRRICRFRNSVGVELQIEVEKFLSIAHMHLGALKYEITALNQDVHIVIESYLDSAVHNIDAHENQCYWEDCPSIEETSEPTLYVKTKKTGFELGVAMVNLFGGKMDGIFEQNKTSLYVAQKFQQAVQKGEKLSLVKLVSVYSSRDTACDLLISQSLSAAQQASELGYDALKTAHISAWGNRWKLVDIEITGDEAAQQGIRYNLFQLLSTYDGRDAKLNIGPKGFTGEKYGGGTYWDTEAFCFPMYLSFDQNVAKNLLLYRYYQLEQACINAKKQGLEGALYPMVTMNGLECHNEWEITFEEIHRNGAIAYAIYQYVMYTDDWSYMNTYGLEVLVQLSRFWASRVHFQSTKKVYMIHGVTGPNEYENNVNNNWYTNYMAKWTLQFTIQVLQWIGGQFQSENKPNQDEISHWQKIAEQMYLPIDEEKGIFLQQDGFMDKHLQTVDEISPSELPIHKHWSWDKILRSSFIKQADVLQGMYMFSERFSIEEKRRNYEFYQPMTVHESSLSPCVHCVMAAEIGKRAEAYRLFMHASRLDLDNYHTDTVDGLHITSMGGSWLAIVHGFLGMRLHDGKLKFKPMIPVHWQSYQTQIGYRGHKLSIKVSKETIEIQLEGEQSLAITLYGEKYCLQPNQKQQIFL